MMNRVRRSLVLLALTAGTLAFFGPTRADDPPATDPEQAIQDLFTQNKLFARDQYKALRNAWSRRFEQKHQAQIRRAYADDHDALTAWLNANPDIKEEFYTAINEKHDNVEAALRLFRDLYKKYPADKLKAYAGLAIATAVTWDEPGRRGGVYDYVHHQVRCKSTLPPDQVGALENFQYLVDNEAAMQGRVQYLPWEFLVHVVNHRTPLDERKWALKNYLGSRPMFGQCYKQVPYDHGMLKNEPPKLADYPYTLENIRSRGGVCAMQADFAGRVGKCLGVPSEYVWGPGSSGGLHAWVMWVELKQVTRGQIVFSLESFGRYNIDKYYTGNLNDPQTGQPMLDRDMELRLSLAGLDRMGKRQAALVMRAYPILRERLALDLNGQVDYLNKCIGLCPYYEEPWLLLAGLCKDGSLKKKHVSAVIAYANKCLTTFGKFPDFTWKVIDEMLVVTDDTDHLTKIYDALVALYEKADRPDLACQARLKLAQYQVKGGKHKEAANGLAFTMVKFPGEGRYLPKVMDKLEEVCKEYKGGDEQLMRFYLDILPKIPAKRGDEPSKHCITMHEKAITFFKARNKDQVVTKLEQQLAAVKAGGKK